MKRCIRLSLTDRRFQQLLRDKDITKNALRLYLVCWDEWKRMGTFGLMPRAEYEAGSGMSSREIIAAFKLLIRKGYCLKREAWRWPRRTFTTEQENREAHR
jgi:hypothetical protein